MERERRPERALRLGTTLLVVGLAAAACPAPPAPAGGIGTLRVGAASSLRELLERTAPALAAAHPGLAPSFSFEASSTLVRQALAGAPYDVLLSADLATLERLGPERAARARAFLANDLALVARPGAGADPVRSPRDLARVGGTLAVAGPEVPLGRYARAHLAAAGLLGELEPRLVVAANARATLALVESGAADFGLVYRTDAARARRARTLWSAAPGEGPEVLYAVLELGEGGQGAADFLAFLASPAFLREAERLGFRAPLP